MRDHVPARIITLDDVSSKYNFNMFFHKIHLAKYA